MSDDKDIQLLPVGITKYIQHSWLEVEDDLKQAGNIFFKRYTIILYFVLHFILLVILIVLGWLYC